MSAPTEQQVAGRTSDTVNTAKTKKNTRKKGRFKRNQVKFFFAGLPPRTPVCLDAHTRQPLHTAARPRESPHSGTVKKPYFLFTMYDTKL